ncbi:hypothetical protein R3P38DRAFT_3241752 [Favolaschia claudopus]|uniref:Uncharacterized protein n=1 Tax=Favolaschia claudopus TaxID=2862362 RepID=A0AAV9Z595_9AGAR
MDVQTQQHSVYSDHNQATARPHFYFPTVIYPPPSASDKIQHNWQQQSQPGVIYNAQILSVNVSGSHPFSALSFGQAMQSARRPDMRQGFLCTRSPILDHFWDGQMGRTWRLQDIAGYVAELITEGKIISPRRVGAAVVRRLRGG